VFFDGYWWADRVLREKSNAVPEEVYKAKRALVVTMRIVFHNLIFIY